MKTGIVITIYNRPEYLSETLQSISESNLSNTELFLVDDCSTNQTTIELINNFSIDNVVIHKIKNEKNENMFYGLKLGWDYFYSNNFDVLCNLDADVIVKPYWLQTLLQLHELHPDKIVSGFNTLNHPIMESFQTYHTKKSAGGANFLFGRILYPEIKPKLMHYAWDWKVCYRMARLNKDFIVSNPSVIQHIGKSSSLKDHEKFDRAEDY